MLFYSLRSVFKNRGVGDPSPRPCRFPCRSTSPSEMNVPWDVPHVLVPSGHFAIAPHCLCQRLLKFIHKPAASPRSRMPQREKPSWGCCHPTSCLLRYRDHRASLTPRTHRLRRETPHRQRRWAEHRSGPRRTIYNPSTSRGPLFSRVLSGTGTGSRGSRRDTSRAPCQRDGRH